MKILNISFRIVLAIIAFPILSIVFFTLRVIDNFNTIINGFITILIYFFNFKLGAFFLNIFFMFFYAVITIIDIPIGLIVSVLASLATSLEIIVSRLDIRDLGYIFQKAPLRKQT